MSDSSDFVRIPENIEFSTSVEKRGQLDEFDFHLKYRMAVFYPMGCFGVIQSARDVLEPTLEAWRIKSLLDDGFPMAFSFTEACIVKDAQSDLTAPEWPAPRPMPPSNLRVVLEADNLPEPPSLLVLSECVEDLVVHYEESTQAHRTLLMHAYAMVTRIEFEFDSIDAAADTLRIDREILIWIKNVASERSFGKISRKYGRKVRDRRPLDGTEEETLRWIMREMVVRSLEVASGVRPAKKVSVAAGGEIAKSIADRRKRK